MTLNQILSSLKVFAEEYLPEVIIDRETEQERIKGFLQNLLKGMSKVLCIYGKPGIGKTLVAKHVLNQFDELENAISIYLNASALTPRLALKEIYEVVCGENRKLPSPSMVEDIKEKLFLKKNVTLSITINNFDRMNDIKNLLWNITM